MGWLAIDAEILTMLPPFPGASICCGGAWVSDVAPDQCELCRRRKRIRSDNVIVSVQPKWPCAISPVAPRAIT